MSRKRSSPRACRTLVTALVLAAAPGCAAHHEHALEDVARVVSAEEQGTHHETGAAATQAAAVPEVLDFAAETVTGEAFEGSSIVGKNTVFWFWAPGCMDCVREAPHVLAAEKALHSSVTFIGVPGLGDVRSMKAAIRQMNVGGFTQVADPDGALWKRFGVVTQPAYAFVTAAGKVEVVKGALGAAGLRTHVAALTHI